MHAYLKSVLLLVLISNVSLVYSRKTLANYKTISALSFEGPNSWPAHLSVDDIVPEYHSHKYSRVTKMWGRSFLANRNTPKSPSMGGEKTSITTSSLFPTNFGADPTGRTDSTQAFQKTVAALLALSTGRKLTSNVLDLGGATIDLNGGVYLLSAPLSIPRGYGNFKITGGTLVASSSFPVGKCLLETGPGCVGHDTNCNIFFQFSNLYLDCGLQAATGVCVNSGSQVDVGPHILITHFTNTGVLVNGGFEVQVQENWIGQYYWTEGKPSTPNTTGIIIFGNDHYVTNNIIYSADVGVTVTGAANLLTGVHTWNKATQNGGIGILFAQSTSGYTQNRVVGSYLDYNAIVTFSPEHLLITSTFFLGSANIVIASLSSNPTINGLQILQNEFDCYGFTNDTVVLAGSTPFSKVVDIDINDNMVSGGTMTIRSTKASAVLTSNQPLTLWKFDFSQRLLFPFITSAQYSVSWSSNQFARHYIEIQKQGRVVTIHTDQPVTGSAFVEVDQNTPQGCSANCNSNNND